MNMRRILRRSWKHWFGWHYNCHPSRCQKAADIFNQFDYELRAEEAFQEMQARTYGPQHDREVEQCEN